MPLGKAAHIVRGVNDFDDTIDFYHTLGYKELNSGISSIGTKFTLFTDGIINLLISEDQNVYTGLIYFDEDQTVRVNDLESKGYNFFARNELDGKITQAMFEAVTDILGINLVSHSYNEAFIPNKESLTPFGTFGEFTIPTDNFEETKNQLTAIGFKVLHQSDQPYNWGILYDGIIPLGVHQNLKVKNLTLTYFSEDMEDILEEIELKGIKVKYLPDFGKGFGIVKAPDGQEINLFYTDQPVEWTEELIK